MGLVYKCYSLHSAQYHPLSAHQTVKMTVFLQNTCNLIMMFLIEYFYVSH